MLFIRTSCVILLVATDLVLLMSPLMDRSKTKGIVMGMSRACIKRPCKVLKSCLMMPGTENLLYTNDARVLVEILLRPACSALTLFQECLSDPYSLTHHQEASHTYGSCTLWHNLYSRKINPRGGANFTPLLKTCNPVVGTRQAPLETISYRKVFHASRMHVLANWWCMQIYQEIPSAEGADFCNSTLHRVEVCIHTTLRTARWHSSHLITHMKIKVAESSAARFSGAPVSLVAPYRAISRYHHSDIPVLHNRLSLFSVTSAIPQHGAIRTLGTSVHTQLSVISVRDPIPQYMTNGFFMRTRQKQRTRYKLHNLRPLRDKTGSIPGYTRISLLECQCPELPRKNDIHAWKTRSAWIHVINFCRRSCGAIIVQCAHEPARNEFVTLLLRISRNMKMICNIALDRDKNPSAIGIAIVKPYVALPRIHVRVGSLNSLVLHYQSMLRRANGAIVAIWSPEPRKPTGNKDALESADQKRGWRKGHTAKKTSNIVKKWQK